MSRPNPWPLRLATPDDAEAYTHCYIECLAETYAHIMPPEFAQARRDRFQREADETRAELAAMADALAAGRTPQRTHWVAPNNPSPGSGVAAVEGAGEVVGIVSAGPGVASWEAAAYSNPEPPVGWNLDHIYTRRATHGTGLGQALFDEALALPGSDEGRGAWLWILRHNPRAEAFYRRNGFQPDGLEVQCGRSWYHAEMFRMWRPDPPRTLGLKSGARAGTAPGQPAGGDATGA